MFNCRRLLTGLAAAALALAAAAASAADQHVVSLTCRGTEVRKAIQILQTVSDLRVLVDPKVPHTRITITLTDLPAEDALKTVVAAAGLSYRKIGNAFLVEPKEGGTLTDARARAALASAEGLGGTEAATPAGGIVQPDAPASAVTATGPVEPRQAPVTVSPAVLAALERTVEVNVRNGPLTEVMAQLSHSAGVQVTADPRLAAGLVATVELHGIPLKSALELVAGDSGLQISPRPDGVAFVTPGLSLETAQARARRTPASARQVEHGQLWTAEWANVLSSGFTAFDAKRPVRSLRRQSLSPNGQPIEFKPRIGGPRQGSTPAAPAPTTRSKRAVLPGERPAAHAMACPFCGKLVSTHAGFRCAHCGRVLRTAARACPNCGGKAMRVSLPPARCPHCRRSLDHAG